MAVSTETPPAPRRYRWLTWRSVLGCVLVAVAAAATTVAFGFGQISQIQDALNGSKSVKVKNLAATSFGGPQTLLLVGNDTRSVFKYYYKNPANQTVGNLANEMLLVRLDPSKPWISMLSLPRELLTTIPCPNGPVANRLNYALQCGGFTTLVKTVKQITGLSVNHVIEINFTNFEKAVDEIGCVYATIDRRYYHVNVPGGPQYQQINLQPGYQKLCGSQAEQFVSYRHGDTSLVRDARDQSFLLAAKQEFGPTLVDNIGKFERIFGKLVATDAALKSTVGLENLGYTLVGEAGKPVRRVQVSVNLQPTDPAAIACNCTTANPGALQAAANSFLYGSSQINKRATAAVAQRLHGRSGRHAHGAPAPPAANALAADTELEALARAAQPKIDFPLEFPAVQIASGTGLPIQVRDYVIHAPGGEPFPAYVVVYPTGLLGQYYDVQGTTWTTAPTFDNPTQSVEVGGTRYYIWYEGSHIQQVAWYEHRAVYWVRNSLTDAVTNGQMLAIAEQTAPVVGAVPASRAVLRLKAGPAPTRLVPSAAVSAWENIGWIGGLTAIALLPLALTGVLLGRRRLLELRERAFGAVTRAGQLEALLATAARPGGAVIALTTLRRLEPLPVGPTAATRAAERMAVRSGPAAAGAADRRGAVTATGGSGVATGRAARGAAAASAPYRAYRTSRVPGWLLPVAAVVIVLAVAGVVLASVLSSAPPKPHRVPNLAATRPDVPVAVLNGGTVPGAAAELGTQLKHQGVNVTTEANLGAAPPVGLEVLYTPGQMAQADRLARLLKGQSPTIAPADPVAEGAAGTAARVIVVLP